ncbi:MAG TPA: ANTAR domain-containing protein, partial [Propionibacteriaceae bacterium]
YRSFASIPLRSPDLPRFGALDLYSTQTTALSQILVDEIEDSIAGLISGMLFAAPTVTYQHGVTLPTWLNVESVTYRMNVWVAVGMLMEHADLTNTDALSVLRAFAFGQSTTLDDIARQITNRELTAQAVLT